MGTNLVLSAALALTTSLTAAGLSPAAPQDGGKCGWRITAVHVLAELTGDDSARAEQLRQALLEVGANEPGFVPNSCYTAPDPGGSGFGGSGSGGSGSGGSGSGGSDSGGGSDPGSSNAGGGSGSGTGGGDQPDSGQGVGSGTDTSGQDQGQGSGHSPGEGSGQGQGQGPSAGEAFGWGEPAAVDDFEAGLSGWNLYDGAGHAGNGVRSPDAASVSDGILTINGAADGTTAGMAWTGNSQQYGRWEVRMRAPEGDPAYNALALLWPTEENFPVGGEVDFAEIMDPARDKVELFLHYGEDNSQVHGEVQVDATEWHNYAVEWTPEGITAFLDGEQWWKTTDTSILPPGPMHLCLQLDWFPDGGSGGTGQVSYDWVKRWPLGEGDGASTDSEASEGSTDADSSTTITDEINQGQQ